MFILVLKIYSEFPSIEYDRRALPETAKLAKKKWEGQEWIPRRKLVGMRRGSEKANGERQGQLCFS